MVKEPSAVFVLYTCLFSYLTIFPVALYVKCMWQVSHLLVLTFRYGSFARLLCFCGESANLRRKRILPSGSSFESFAS